MVSWRSGITFSCPDYLLCSFVLRLGNESSRNVKTAFTTGHCKIYHRNASVRKLASFLSVLTMLLLVVERKVSWLCAHKLSSFTQKISVTLQHDFFHHCSIHDKRNTSKEVLMNVIFAVIRFDRLESTLLSLHRVQVLRQQNAVSI